MGFITKLFILVRSIFNLLYTSIVVNNFIHRKFQHKTTGYNYRYPILSIDMYLSNIYQLQFNCYAFRMDPVTLIHLICGEPIEYINQVKYICVSSLINYNRTMISRSMPYFTFLSSRLESAEYFLHFVTCSSIFRCTCWM